MNFEERYGWLDRLLCRIAFRGGTTQRALADVEDLLYDEQLDDISVSDPVFISGLPRAGTTILLRLLWQTDRFATHTYQDMPFLLCPLLWNRFTRQFATDATTRERAHADGLTVSETSPEAFEEMIWKHFWPEAYRGDCIEPWSDNDPNPAFNHFFATHMRKVIAVRSTNGAVDLRYLSKNNLNIARLGALPPPLQQGTFLVPFRAPLQQAASMLQQHERFLSIHEEDDFVREYMEAIGHHEFGKGLRPINFDGWVQEAPDASQLAFWMQYWISAYEYVLDRTDENVVLLSYDRLINEPRSTLARLAEILSVAPGALTDQADQLRPPRAHDVDTDAIPSDLHQRATALHNTLTTRAPLG